MKLRNHPSIVHYDDLISTVHAGDKITVDNGLINLEVLEKHERMIALPCTLQRCFQE